jgi:hypothetical protein
MPEEQKPISSEGDSGAEFSLKSSLLIHKYPQGVGGWLLFFCILLTFFVPTRILYELVTSFQSGLELNSVGWFYVVADAALAAFTFLTGVLLWRGRRNAVSIAKYCLLAHPAFALAFTLR